MARASSGWALALVLFAPPALAGAEGGRAPALSASCFRVGDAAGGVRLAVRWTGAAPLAVVAWGDADGDGARGPGEPVLAAATLAPGYAVLDLDAAPAGKLRVGAAADGAAALSVLVAGDCAWREGFAASGLDGLPRTGAGYDDGGGEQLYLGGDFTTAGDVVVNHIARWDGANWSAVPGSTAIGTDGDVFAMEVFEGHLYVGGLFTRAGDVAATNLARWSAAGWEAVGNPDGGVFALNRHEDVSGMKLYAGGGFTHIAGMAAGRIARFDGAVWSNVGPAGGFNGTVYALDNYDDGPVTRMFAGGDFTAVDGPGIANHIARWDGTGWSTLGTGPSNGVDGTVYDLAVYTEAAGEALFVGGFFGTAMGSIETKGIARWRALAWSAVGGGFSIGAAPGLVLTLNLHDDGGGPQLVAGGHFTAAGDLPASNLARWNGTAWSAQFGSSAAGADREVFAVGALGEGPGAELLVAGAFREIGGVRASRIAVWSGDAAETFRPLGAPPGDGLDDDVHAMAVYDEGAGPRLFVGGDFISAGEVGAAHVARWDGTQWSEVHSMVAGGVDGVVYALEVWNDGTGAKLYAGGWFRFPGHNVGVWNGIGWAALANPFAGGEGTDGPVYALRGYDAAPAPGLYVGGDFAHAGGLAAEGLARWTGSAWDDVVSDFSPAAAIDGEVYALDVFDDGGGPALFAGGNFAVINRGATNLARWRGNDWSKLGNAGPDWAVNALAVWDDGAGPALFAGGWFTHADGIEANHVVRWSGAAWAPLAGPAGNGTDDVVWTLAPHVDGNGHALFAGGRFLAAGGLPAERVARWDGAGWAPLDDPLGRGPNEAVLDLLSWNDGRGSSLWAAGRFAAVGDLASARLARWACDTIFWDDYETGDAERWDSGAGLAP